MNKLEIKYSTEFDLIWATWQHKYPNSPTLKYDAFLFFLDGLIISSKLTLEQL
jgi:hypothetical protein